MHPTFSEEHRLSKVTVYRAVLSDDARKARVLAREFATATLAEGRGVTGYAKAAVASISRRHRNTMRLSPINVGTSENFSECTVLFTNPDERTARAWMETYPRTYKAWSKIMSLLEARRRR